MRVRARFALTTRVDGVTPIGVSISYRNNDRFTPRDATIKGSGSDGGVVEAGEVDAGTTPHIIKRKGLPVVQLRDWCHGWG
jgi:hypothetical protein